MAASAAVATVGTMVELGLAQPLILAVAVAVVVVPVVEPLALAVLES